MHTHAQTCTCTYINIPGHKRVSVYAPTISYAHTKHTHRTRVHTTTCPVTSSYLYKHTQFPMHTQNIHTVHVYIQRHAQSQAATCTSTHNCQCIHKHTKYAHKFLIHTNGHTLFIQNASFYSAATSFIFSPSSYSYISITNITKSNTLFILIICLGTLYIFSPPPSYSYVCRICFPMHSSSSSSPRPLLPLLLLR